MNEMLKIGIICHPTYGGSGVVASELALSLADEGHCVHLFSHEVPPRMARSPGPVQMHRAQGIPYPLFHSTPHDLAITSAILNVHRDGGLDVLHAHYALPHAVSAFLARAAAETDSGRPAPRTVTTLHGTDITLVGNDPSYAPLTQFVINASDAATAVSEWLAEETRERFCPEMSGAARSGSFQFRGHRLVQAPARSQGSGPHAPGGARQQLPARQARALAVPGLRPGDPRSRGPPDPGGRRSRSGPSAGAWVHELGIEQAVTFLGARDAIPDLLAPADVFALSSQEESFGLSALEAMACGTPVVATDAGGIREVIDHGVTGLLSAPEDLEGFAAHLRALLFGETDGEAMGRAAREQALERFQPRKIVAAYEALYRRVIARRA